MDTTATPYRQRVGDVAMRTIINFINREDGGRRKAPANTYAPLLSLDDDTTVARRSVVVRFDEEFDADAEWWQREELRATVEPLVGPWATPTPHGRAFSLWEGLRRVARGTVLGEAEEAAQKAWLAELLAGIKSDMDRAFDRMHWGVTGRYVGGGLVGLDIRFGQGDTLGASYPIATAREDAHKTIVGELRMQAYTSRYRASDARKEAVKWDEYAARLEARANEMEKKS